MQWRKHCQQVMKKMKAFKPDLVLVSAGFDAHMNDTFGEGHINLNNQDYYWIANELTTEFPRVVSVLEGGYNIDVLSMCCTSHIQGLGYKKRVEQQTSKQASVCFSFSVGAGGRSTTQKQRTAILYKDLQR